MKNFKLAEGIVIINKDNNNNLINKIGYISRDNLYIINDIKSDKKYFPTMMSVSPNLYEYDYIKDDDKVLFKLVVSMMSYLGDIHLESSKYHLENSEGQRIASLNSARYFVKQLYKNLLNRED